MFVSFISLQLSHDESAKTSEAAQLMRDANFLY
jgi:hypothetical protein